MTETKPWPWPGETRDQRAKRVARSYRDLVQDIAQGRCTDPAGELHRLDMHWQQFGIRWLIPDRKPIDINGWMTAPDLAQYLDRTRKDIYNWARLGHIEQRASADGSPEYSVSSVVSYQQVLTRRRHASEAHQPPP